MLVDEMIKQGARLSVFGLERRRGHAEQTSCRRPRRVLLEESQDRATGAGHGRRCRVCDLNSVLSQIHIIDSRKKKKKKKKKKKNSKKTRNSNPPPKKTALLETGNATLCRCRKSIDVAIFILVLVMNCSPLKNETTPQYYATLLNNSAGRSSH